MGRYILRKQARSVEVQPNGLPEGLVTVLDPSSPASESYRTLRTSLLYAVVGTPLKVIVVTSPGPAEGKSITCANLGVVLAQADKNVLLLDCNLRGPTLHKIFNLPNTMGIVNLVGEDCGLQEVWQEPLPGLKVVTVGTLPPDPAELLSSRRFAQVIDQVKQEFDYILIDSPPAGQVSDPTIVATLADGVLVVINSQKTRKGALQRAVRSLEAVGANVLGTVLNRRAL